MSLGNKLDPAMLNKLDQRGEEDFPAFFVLLLVGEVLTDEGGDEFLLCDLKEESELLSLS